MSSKINSSISIILSSILLIMSNIVNAEIVKTDSVKSVLMQSISQWVDKDTIVFIDLDDTLMTPKSLMFSHHKINPFNGFIESMVNRGKHTNHYNITVTKWYQQRQVREIEKEWPDYINDLKDKGAAVYAMCKMPLHLINIEAKRYLEAKELGLSFTEKVNGQEVFEIKKHIDWFSFFYKGIIFTGPYTRSHIVLEFLKVTSNVPKKILFISSFESELKNLEKKLKPFHTELYNVRYLAIKNMPGRPDPEIVKYQQKKLLHTGIWMEDEEAKEEMQNY